MLSSPASRFVLTPVVQMWKLRLRPLGNGGEISFSSFLGLHLSPSRPWVLLWELRTKPSGGWTGFCPHSLEFWEADVGEVILRMVWEGG